eukprot:Skav202861  [mRNA]  locus=scaffold3206:48538:52147:- [translate_table: standard]
MAREVNDALVQAGISEAQRIAVMRQLEAQADQAQPTQPAQPAQIHIHVDNHIQNRITSTMSFYLYEGCCSNTALQSGDVERLEMCGLSRRDVAKIIDIIDRHFVCVK